MFNCCDLINNVPDDVDLIKFHTENGNVTLSNDFKSIIPKLDLFEKLQHNHAFSDWLLFPDSSVSRCYLEKYNLLSIQLIWYRYRTIYYMVQVVSSYGQ